MTKLLHFPNGNSQKTPEHEALSSVEAPIIASEVNGGDPLVARMYDLIMRMHVSSAAIEGASHESPATGQLLDMTERFRNRNIDSSNYDTGNAYAQKVA